MQDVLHALAQGFVLTGDHRGSQRVLGDLARQVRPRQHANAGLGGDLFKDLAHQLEALRLDALGQADQAFAAQQLGMGRQHAAQGARWQGNEDQVAGLQRGQQVVDRLDAVQQADALEVARILAVDAHGLGLFRVTHPLAHRHAVFRQQVSHGSAEASAAQNCNRLLFSHIQSVKAKSKWRPGHYTARLRQKQCQCRQ
ncbi:hypothetical protein D3C76_992770 [compost metagenome]